MLASRSASRCCEGDWKEGDLEKGVKVVATAWEREGNSLIRVKLRAEPANQACGKEPCQQRKSFSLPSEIRASILFTTAYATLRRCNLYYFLNQHGNPLLKCTLFSSPTLELLILLLITVFKT